MPAWLSGSLRECKLAKGEITGKARFKEIKKKKNENFTKAQNMNLSWEQTKTAPAPILLSGLCLSQFEVTELGTPGSSPAACKGAGETLWRSPLQSAVTLKLSVWGTRRAQGVQAGEKTREMHADLVLACKDAAERSCSALLPALLLLPAVQAGATSSCEPAAHQRNVLKACACLWLSQESRCLWRCKNERVKAEAGSWGDAGQDEGCVAPWCITCEVCGAIWDTARHKDGFGAHIISV